MPQKRRPAGSNRDVCLSVSCEPFLFTVPALECLYLWLTGWHNASYYLPLHRGKEYTYPFSSCRKAKIHLGVHLALGDKVVLFRTNYELVPVSVKVSVLVVLHSSEGWNWCC